MHIWSVEHDERRHELPAEFLCHNCGLTVFHGQTYRMLRVILPSDTRHNVWLCESSECGNLCSAHDLAIKLAKESFIHLVRGDGDIHDGALKDLLGLVVDGGQRIDVTGWGHDMRARAVEWARNEHEANTEANAPRTERPHFIPQSMDGTAENPRAPIVPGEPVEKFELYTDDVLKKIIEDASYLEDQLPQGTSGLAFTIPAVVVPTLVGNLRGTRKALRGFLDDHKEKDANDECGCLNCRDAREWLPAHP